MTLGEEHEEVYILLHRPTLPEVELDTTKVRHPNVADWRFEKTKKNNQ